MHGERTVLSGAAPAALSFTSAKARKRQTLGGEGEERASKVQRGLPASVGGGGGKSSHGKRPGSRPPNSSKGAVPEKLLSANLSNSSTLAELWNHVGSHIAEFNSIHVCVALRALRKLLEGGRDGDQDYPAWIATNVLTRAGEVAGTLDKRNLLSVFENGTAVNAVLQPAALEAVLRRASRLASTFSLGDTTSLFASISAMGASGSTTKFCTRGSDRLLEEVLHKALESASGFTTVSIVHLMKVLAAAQLVVPQPAWDAMQAAVLTTPARFDAREIATLMRALAEMGRRPGARLWEVLWQRAVEIANDFEPEDIAELMWAVNPTTIHSTA